MRRRRRSGGRFVVVGTAREIREEEGERQHLIGN